MRFAHGLGLVTLTFFGAAIAAYGEQSPPSELQIEQERPTGLQPIGQEEYNKLPKLPKFRAWLPKKVDLSVLFPLPGDQTPKQNCTAWATTYSGLGYLHGVELGHRPTGPGEELSPAYVYDRLKPPGSNCNVATRIVDALNLLTNEGTVTLADFPDVPTECSSPAAPAVVSKAAGQRLGAWRAIDRETPNDWRTPVVIDDIKGALFRQEPVVFAMPAVADLIMFQGPGIYTHDKAENRNWHAMALVGYDEDRQAFRIINSWGRKWGDGGYAWISYETFKRMAGEAYALENVNQAPVAPEMPANLTPRQQLDDQIGRLPCGEARSVTAGGHLSLSGYAGSEDALAQLHKAMLAVDPQAKWDMDYHPWPQCEAEMTLGTPLKTGGVTLAAKLETGEPRTGDPVVMTAGEKFGIAAETNAAKPYLSIVYLQADGSAIELYRGKPDPDAAGHRKVTVGTGGPKQVRFQVGPPYGSEMVIAIASAAPFFGPELSTYATERQFLTGLRGRLTRERPGSVAASVLRLRTHG